MSTRRDASTHHLQRPGGRVAFDVSGDGPLVVCLPGMGDLRSSYRFLAPVLVDAGFRVATMDLRGHGDSDAGFDSYDDVATGEDVLALVEHLDAGPAVLVGSSLGGAAATWAAAERPEAVSGLVLLGAFVREVPSSALVRLGLRLALQKPWGPAVWSRFYASLFPSAPPADLAGHRAAIREWLRQPGRWRAFVATTRTSHAPVEARLAEVRAPALAVMGSKDPDFPDPAAELELQQQRLGARTLLVDGVGHYPHGERPETVAPAVVAFLREATATGTTARG